MTAEFIHVAAAAIEDAAGRILITKRHRQAHQGGLWEFPGGKLEAGETAIEALQRELQEELDITPIDPQRLISVRHRYQDRAVRLDVFLVRTINGTPRGMEGQPMSWLYPSEMKTELFPAADRPILTALKLPSHYLITGDEPRQRDSFLETLSHSLQKGLRLVQLRAHQLPDGEYRTLAEECLTLCQRFGARLLLNRPQHTERWIGLADGVHLNRHQLMLLVDRPPGTACIGASCHDPTELEHAQRLELDYALLSPVCTTASHPLAEPLGWERFANWVEAVNLPVYALGGLTMLDLDLARAKGAQGVAGISGFWSSQSP